MASRAGDGGGSFGLVWRNQTGRRKTTTAQRASSSARNPPSGRALTYLPPAIAFHLHDEAIPGHNPGEHDYRMRPIILLR